jgi:3-oxoacyl-[acyl-carrier protein] reductase
MAQAFVSEGAQVVCADVDSDGLSSLAANVTDEPGEVLTLSADIRSWDDVQRMVDRTLEEFGRIDILVNNAGVQQRTAGGDDHFPVVDVPVDIWDKIIDTNLRGAFLCTKAVLPSMLERDKGRLIHISSGAGAEGRKNRSPYVASKFGLEGLCESLALELDGTGIDSIVFRPPGGGVYTESREYRGQDDYAFPSPQVVAEPAVKLAAGAGEHGKRYEGTPDGEDFVEDPR